MLIKCYSGPFLLLHAIITICQSLQCFETVYPRVLGGTNANTDIYSFDLDTNYNLVFSGGTSDTSIQSAGSPNPVVAYVKDGGVYLWSKYFSPNTLKNVILVKFNTLATKVVAVLDSTPLQFVTLDATNGAILYSYSNSGGSSFSTVSGALIIDSSDNVYLAMQGSSTWELTKFTIAAPPISSVWAKSAGGLLAGQAFSLVFGESQSALYVGGMIQSLPSYYQSLTRVLNDGTINWHYGWGSQPLIYSNYYQMNRIVFSTFAAVNYIFGCSQGVATYSKNIAITKFTLNSVTTTVPTSVSYLDSSSSSNAFCEGIYARDANSVYAIIYYATGDIHYTFTDLSLVTPTISHTLLSSVSDSSTVANYALFISETSVYFGGYLKKVNGASPVQTYSFSVGFIMTYDTLQSCLTITYTTTSVLLTANAFSFSSFSPSVSTSTISLIAGGITNQDTLSTGTISSSAWCKDQVVTLTPPTIPNQTFTVKTSSSITVSYAAFTTTPTCSDTAFTYTATLASTAALPSCISFSASAKTFTIYSITNADVGTYSVVLTGTVATNQYITTTFTVTIYGNCATAVIIANTVADMSYAITSTTTLQTFPAFFVCDPTCPVTYTMTLVGGGAIDSTVFAIASSSRGISIYSSDASKIGVYKFRVTGTVTGFSIFDTTTFTATLTVNCALATITSPAIAGYTYSITPGTLTTIATLAWTVTPTACATMTYVLQNQDTTASDTTVVNLVGTTIQVQTTAFAKIGTYNLEVVGKASTYATAIVKFVLTVMSQCSTTVITTTPISSYTYDINSGSLSTIATLAWTQSQTGCPAITYALQNQDGTTSDITVVNLNTNLIQVQTSLVAKVGTYTLEVIGSVTPYATAIVKFTLYVIQSCSSDVITSTAIPTYTYDIRSGTLNTITTLAWTQSQPSCPTITYVFQNQDTTAADSTVVYLTSPTIYVQTSSTLKVGTYNLEVIGSVTTFTSATVKFILKVIDGCQVTVVTPSTISTQSYYVGNSALTFTYIDWTSSVTPCGTFGYTATLSSGLALPSFIAYSSSLRQFVIYSTTTSDVGTYSIKITGTLTTGPSATYTFILNVLDPCPLAILTGPTVADQSYQIKTPSIAVSMGVFTSSVPSSICGPFHYTLTYSSGFPINTAIFTFNSAIPSLNIYTTSTASVGTYILAYSAYSGTYTSDFVTTLFKVYVTDACLKLNLTTSGPMMQIYDVAASLMTIQIQSFTPSVANCGTIVYTCQNTDGTSLDSSVFTFNPITLQLQVYTLDFSKVGKYYMQVTGTVSGYASATMNIRVIISLGCESSAVQPIPIQNQYYHLGYQLKFFNFDSWLKATAVCGIKLQYVATLINNNSLPSCVSFDGTYRIFVVHTNDTNDVGRYQIRVTGFDNNYKISKQVNFTLTIVQNSTEAMVVKTNSTSLQIEQQLMTAWIVNISRLGVVLVEFSDPILYYPDFINLSPKTLVISFSSDRTYVVKFWSVIDYGNQTMTIQLNLTDSMEIGTSVNADILFITFIEGEYIFFSANLTKHIPRDYVISKAVPAQFPSQYDLTITNIIGELLAILLAILAACSFIFEILMDGSLSMLWGLINTIQLLIYVPLFTIAIPSNLQMVITNIVNILNPNFFNIKNLERDILSLQNTSSPYNDRFDFMGYRQSNFILNVGFGLFPLYIYPILLGIYLLLRKQKKWLAIKASAFLKRFVYFNGILRYFYQLTLVVCTASIIQILTQNEYNQAGDIVSLIIAMVMLCITLPLVFMPAFLIRNKELLEKKDFKLTYYEVYEGIITKENLNIIFFSLYFVRRVAFLGLVFLASKQPGIQVAGFLILNLGTITYIIYLKPFEDPLRLKIEAFNEVCHMLASYTLIAFTDLLSSASGQYKFGWFYIAILAMNLLFNSVFIVLSLYNTIKKFIKRLMAWYDRSKMKVTKFQSSQVYPKTNLDTIVEAGNEDCSLIQWPSPRPKVQQPQDDTYPIYSPRPSSPNNSLKVLKFQEHGLKNRASDILFLEEEFKDEYFKQDDGHDDEKAQQNISNHYFGINQSSQRMSSNSSLSNGPDATNVNPDYDSVKKRISPWLFKRNQKK